MNLRDLSLKISDEEYRNSGVHYSQISKYINDGVDGLLKDDNQKSESLKFGSLVDCLALSPDEFKSIYRISDITEPSPAVKNVCDVIYERYSDFTFVDDKIIESIIEECGYSPKRTTVMKIKKEGGDYINELYNSSEFIVISKSEYDNAVKTVNRLKNSHFGYLFDSNENIFTQLVFNNGCIYVKPDIIVVDDLNSEIHIYDLKTTSKSVYDFNESYIRYNYYVQQYLYRESLKAYLLNSSTEYSNYTVIFDGFVVVDRNENHPVLLWSFDDKKLSEMFSNLNERKISIGNYYMYNPNIIVDEVFEVLSGTRKHPVDISLDKPNDIYKRLIK